MKRLRLILGWVLACLGALGLGVDAYGWHLADARADLTAGASARARAVIGSDFAEIADFHVQDGRVPTVPDRVALERDALSAYNATLYDAMTHYYGDQRQYLWYENWLLWSAGAIREDFRLVGDSSTLIRGGTGNCTQLAGIVIATVARSGGRARFVGPDDVHTCAEVELPDGSRIILDPDFGVVVPYSSDYLQKKLGAGELVDPALDQQMADHGWQGAYRTYLGIWAKAPMVSTPWNAPSRPKFAQIEALSFWLIWLIPTAALILGTACIATARQGKVISNQ